MFLGYESTIGQKKDGITKYDFVLGHAAKTLRSVYPRQMSRGSYGMKMPYIERNSRPFHRVPGNLSDFYPLKYRSYNFHSTIFQTHPLETSWFFGIFFSIYFFESAPLGRGGTHPTMAIQQTVPGGSNVVFGAHKRV